MSGTPGFISDWEPGVYSGNGRVDVQRDRLKVGSGKFYSAAVDTPMPTTDIEWRPDTIWQMAVDPCDLKTGELTVWNGELVHHYTVGMQQAEGVLEQMIVKALEAKGYVILGPYS